MVDEPRQRVRSKLEVEPDQTEQAYAPFFVREQTLETLFRQAGFVDIRRAQTGDSQAPEFRDLDMREDWRAAMTIFIEARRGDADPSG